MKRKGFFKWFTLDMLVFVGVNAFLISHFQNRFGILLTVSYFELLILGLASYRAANILSNEAVTKPLRAPFMDETENSGKIVEEPKKKGFMGAMGTLIYCPSCTGVWLAAALVYLYVFFPKPTLFVAFFLALSAIERIISALVGWLKQK